GIETDRDEDLGETQRGVPQLGRVLGDGEGVQVDDAVDAVGPMLIVDPVDQRTQEVPEVDVAGRLDAGEHAGHGRRSYGSPGLRQDRAQRWVTRGCAVRG